MHRQPQGPVKALPEKRQTPSGTSREEAERKATDNLTKRHRKRNKGDVIHQERDGEDGHKQTTVQWRSLADGLCSERANTHK